MVLLGGLRTTWLDGRSGVLEFSLAEFFVIVYVYPQPYWEGLFKF